MKRIVRTTNGCLNESVDKIFGMLPDEPEGVLLYNGRNRVVRVSGVDDPSSIVVKLFPRPNIFQRIGSLFGKTKARQAMENAAHLVQLGCITPEVYGIAEEFSNGMIDRSALITSDFPWEPVRSRLLFDHPGYDLRLADALGKYIAWLHRNGILHDDLNNTNIVFDPVAESESAEYRFGLIDINRMTFYPGIAEMPLDRRIRNMVRFTRSDEVMTRVARAYALETGEDAEMLTECLLKALHRFLHRRDLRRRIFHPFG